MPRSTREWPPPRAHARSENTHGTPGTSLRPFHCALPRRNMDEHMDIGNVAHIAARSARLDGYSRCGLFAIHNTSAAAAASPLAPVSRRGSSSFVVALTFGSHSCCYFQHVSSQRSHLTFSFPIVRFSGGAQPTTAARGSEATYVSRRTSSAKTPIEIWYRTDAER